MNYRLLVSQEARLDIFDAFRCMKIKETIWGLSLSYP